MRTPPELSSKPSKAKSARKCVNVQPLAACLFLAGLLAVSLPGTATAESLLPAPALPSASTAPPISVLMPASDARIKQAISTLDGLAKDVLQRTDIPGLAIAVVHNGQTVYARGFGKRAVGRPERVDAATVFLLASLSKPVGATVVATQVDAGHVSWNSPVKNFLPSFDTGDPWINNHVTIGDLYAHRSGLPDHAGDDLEDIGFDRDTVLDRLALLPKGAFRTEYAYTNFGLTAAAEAVAIAADTDWADLSEKALYEPLGMSSTSSRHAEYMARDNRASSHVISESKYVVADKRQPDAQSPAGGVSSNVQDMARWMSMVLGRGSAYGIRLVSQDALLPALSPQIIRGAPMDISARHGAYGFGFNVDTRLTGRVMLSHSGAFALGASTSVAMVPDFNLGIVVLTNAPPTGAAEAITASFLDRAELGIDSRDWLAAYAPVMAPLSAPVGHLLNAEPPVDVAPAKPLKAYVGTYDNAYFGSASVVVTKEGLALKLGPQGRELSMRHWNADSFVVYPVTENQPAGSVSLVKFAALSSQPGMTMQVEHLNAEGLGIFQRQE